MNNNFIVTTTFANSHFEPFAKEMISSFARLWPAQVSLFLQLDNDLLLPDVRKILRTVDYISTDWSVEHKKFVERNAGKDHPNDYRLQPVRFCHKVFAIKAMLDAIKEVGANGGFKPRYLIWMDADVHTIRPVTLEELKECMPKEGDAVAYMGRKDWDHSECGWLAFDLENGGDAVIDMLHAAYADDEILTYPQQHDSWAFDLVCQVQRTKRTNLTMNATGRDVWEQSPMGKWSIHHKGPAAKAKLSNENFEVETNPPMPPQRGGGIKIQTRNSIPHAEICKQIAKNQTLIKNWILPCAPVQEEIVVVSAGPQLIAEDVRAEAEAGKRIVAVKNALVPLKKAGITPWACILLDPRPHVANFVQDADTETIWFVASQVNPTVTLELLARGCTVWGYHANVSAGEDELIMKQQGAIVSGGSATATRGLHLLHHLGFSHFILHGYDLCFPDKPDFNARDEFGQQKYIEITVNTFDPFYSQKRLFFTEPQLWAQFEEMMELIKGERFKFKAHGNGLIPFMIRAKEIGDMRRADLRKLLAGEKPPNYAELLKLG